MNVLVTTNLERFAPDRLPPRHRDSRTRILFVTNDVLGWRTFGRLLQKETAGRDDIAAVHVSLVPTRRIRVLSEVRVPHVYDAPPHVRLMSAWRKRIGAWLEGPLDLRYFDLVHVAPQIPAIAFAEHKAQHADLRLSTVLDGTVRQAKSSRKGLESTEVVRRFGPLVDAEREVIRQADLVWAMSRWAANGIRDENGLDREIGILPPVVRCAHKEWGQGISGNQFPVHMAFVGNDFVRKGGPRLLRWHQQWWSDRVRLHVFTAHKMPSNHLTMVDWHRSVPHDELINDWLPQMDLFVMPTHSDMSPFAVSEAVEVGLPVVSTEIGGLSDLVINGETGYLAPVDDDGAFKVAIESLIDDAALRMRMGLATRHHADETLDPVTIMQGFLDTLVKCAA